MSEADSWILVRNPCYRGVVPAAAAALDAEVPSMAEVLSMAELMAFEID